jgi:phosphohistidine phosphatase
VLRHAAAAQGGGVADAGRPLTAGGRLDAAAAGDWLRQSGLRPDTVACSTARRARETWQEVSARLGPVDQAAVSFDSRLYDSGLIDGMLTVVREAPPDAGVVLLVGHNPAAQQLVIDLTGRCDSFPAGSLAVITLPGGWAAAVSGAGELADFWTPRGQG